MADRKESAADIKVALGDETKIVVERLSVTKNIDISTIYGSGRVMPDAYSIDQISYQGNMELMGNKLDLEDKLFDGNGIPKEATLNITHFDDSLTSFTEVLATSEGYEMNAGETTTTSFDFIAMGKSTEQATDTQP